MLNEINQINNFISSSVSGTVIDCSGSGSDFLTSYGSGSGSTSQKVTVPTVPVPVPQHCYFQWRVERRTASDGRYPLRCWGCAKRWTSSPWRLREEGGAKLKTNFPLGIFLRNNRSRTSVADPGSGAILTLGSGRSGMNIPDHIS
jgi:hypothetical protein